jgi:hypothetical protein
MTSFVLMLIVRKTEFCTTQSASITKHGVVRRHPTVRFSTFVGAAANIIFSVKRTRTC